MRLTVLLAIFVVGVNSVVAEAPRVFPPGEKPADSRLEELRTLNGYFPFKPVKNKQAWSVRQAEIKRRILISQGLWPEPTKTELKAVVHGRMEYDGYTVEKVYFQAMPGNFVTGSLYRPKGRTGPFPAVLCPHGHWMDARFRDAGEKAARDLIATGGERFMNAARNHHQARCVQLARMGCIAFIYDMTGCCDSIQLGHRPDKAEHLDTAKDWGFFSVQAELRLQNMMGLQTWNSIRSVDFLLELSDVDPQRIGVTGASGGGTQSMILGAIDDRISAAMPCVMASTAMQGGCTCENAPLMRIDQGNIDIAAAIAPKPLGLTAADDWTKELETKGYPALRNLYEMLGHKNRLTAVFNTHFPHNYNHVNRTVMYEFYNQHFKLSLDRPVLEADFELLPQQKMTVWNEQHPAPTGTKIGDPHEIRLLQMATKDSDEKLAALIPKAAEDGEAFRTIVGGAWETIIGRTFDQVGQVTFTKTKTTTVDGFELELGRLDHVTAAEQLPAIQLKTVGAQSRSGVVVWITSRGKSGVLDGDKVIKPVKHLLNKGYTVVTADLSGQGEFLSTDEPLTEQRMWYQRKATNAWERFSGYTYGYNHSLFVKRTHDILSLVKHATVLSQGRPVHIVGRGQIAGPLVLAARGQVGEAISTTVIDLAGYRFEDLSRHDDPMFVSGAVKYLDVDGLLSQCAPHRVAITGIGNSIIPQRVYSAEQASDELRIVDQETLTGILEQL